MSSTAFAVFRDRALTARNKLFVRLFSGITPYYIVNEFPKSGGTWLTQMLSDALELPFHRNELVRLEPSAVHGHYLHPAGLHNVTVLWRDPRDLLVSLYYHSYFVAEFHDKKFGNKQLVTLMRRRCPFDDYEDIRSNLPAFIRFVSTTPLAPRFTWLEFASEWFDKPGTVQARYEVLRKNPAEELQRIVHALGRGPLPDARAEKIAEARSFARAKAAAEAARDAKTEISFVREGSVGGWRRHFSEAADAELERYGYFATMRRVGYER